MRVLFVYRFCGLGGVETSILNKLDALEAEGIHARALFGEFYGSGGRSIAQDSRVMVGLTEDRLRAALRQDFDVITVIDHPYLLDTLSKLHVRSRVIFETHTSLPEALPLFYSRLDDPLIAAIAVPSPFNQKLVEASLRTPKPVVVIPNPIDGSRFRPDACGHNMDLTLRCGGPILLWVGRLEKEKHPEEFLSIACQLLKRGVAVQPLLLGDAFDDAEYSSRVESLLASVSEPWRSEFAFVRSVPYVQMPALYSWVAAGGGCLVSTSLYESAPMILLEAMSCGCPVIASRVGGVPEMIADEEDGLLYPPGDIARAVERILNLLDGSSESAPAGSTNASVRAALTASGKAMVQAKHSPKVFAEQYRALLDSVLPANRSHLSKSASAANNLPADGDHDYIPGMVSTIIPVYNRAGMLYEAVVSVLSQTYDNIEIILVDDGSTDETAELCDHLARDYPAIRTLHIQHLGRAGLVREAGRRIARGEYIQYLDSDDLLMPAKFDKMVALLEANLDCDISYCFTRRYRIGEPPPTTPAGLTGQSFDRISPAFITRRYWLTPSCLYRRKLTDLAGAWSDLRFWEDIEYDLRMAAFQPKLVQCGEWLTEVRDHESARLSGLRFLEHPASLTHAVRGLELIYRNIRNARLDTGDEHVRSFIDDIRVIYNRCVHYGLEQEAETCAEIVMDGAGESRENVGRYDIRARLEPGTHVLQARPGEWITLSVNVVNCSSVRFHGGEMATELGYHVRNADGSMRHFESPKIIIEQPLPPGASRTIDLAIAAPACCGLYYLELDLLWAAHHWLNSSQNSGVFVKLLVSESPLERGWRANVSPENSAEIRALGPDWMRLEIQRSSTSTAWHIQANYQHIPVSAGENYRVRFRARADGPRPIQVGFARAHDPWSNLGFSVHSQFDTEWHDFDFVFSAMDSDNRGRVHFDAGGNDASFEIADLRLTPAPDGDPVGPLALTSSGRLGMDLGTKPLSEWWGTDRGLAVHRYYLERFLAEFSADIRGNCLEFQDPQYTPRFGGAAVAKLDILHIDTANPRATLVADLTKPNDLPSDHFDCIICSHVLHVIVDVQRAVEELFRILKAGGVLLVAVPHISMYSEEYGEIWRFTPRGLEVILARAFGLEQIQMRAYGNSLTAAGEIRGVVSQEFFRNELNDHDPRFPVEVCARVLKRGGP